MWQVAGVVIKQVTLFLGVIGVGTMVLVICLATFSHLLMSPHKEENPATARAIWLGSLAVALVFALVSAASVYG